MFLSDRQFKILEAIVNDYIQTAEPIGSRTIAKKYGLGISSATIRNEMSDLEDLGLISQLHTSSGRIPSSAGYRFYVDSMMHPAALTAEVAMFMQRMIIDNIYQTEYMMQETAKTLTHLTKYPAIVSEPHLKKTKIRHIQLVPLDEKSLLLVLVLDTKAVKNQVIHIDAAPDYVKLTELSQKLNQHLTNRTVNEINRALIDKMLASFGNDAHILMPILGIIAGIIQAEDDIKIYTSGIKNILAFPEFSDIKKAEMLFHTLEDRESLMALLGEDEINGIQITIGDENTLELMKDCSLIRTSYRINNQGSGIIALVGPMRMDYAQAVSVITGIVQNMQRVLEALGNG